MPPARLSVVIITLDEESALPRCLQSVDFADQVVVVDSGSQDATCQVAREHGARVLTRPMRGFGEQKQFAVDQADGDWILSLDADEWLSEPLQQNLRQLLEMPLDSRELQDGYLIWRRNIYLGRPMRFCGWYQPIVRLFRSGQGRFNDKLVHEEIEVQGKVGTLPGDLMHNPYRDLSHHLEKIRRYMVLDARELHRRGRRVRGWQAPIHLLGRPAYKLAEKYLVQQGIREGMHGFVLSVMAALGVFLIHAECWRLEAEGELRAKTQKRKAVKEQKGF